MATESSSLCLSCGICCDGTLFGAVPLEGAEIEPARRHKLTLLEGGEPRFSLPCVQHRGGACTIYADRPRVCAGFRCALLTRREAGEVSHEESLVRVQRVKALVRSIRRAIPGADGRRALRIEIDAYFTALGGEAETSAWRQRNAELLMDLKTLKLMIEREFVRKEGQ
jgi:hypothetical protein